MKWKEWGFALAVAGAWIWYEYASTPVQTSTTGTHGTLENFTYPESERQKHNQAVLAAHPEARNQETGQV
jgi:hypothetical protein